MKNMKSLAEQLNESLLRVNENNFSIDVELEDIKHIKGLSKICSNSGRVEVKSFYFDDGNWVQGIQK